MSLSKIIQLIIGVGVFSYAIYSVQVGEILGSAMPGSGDVVNVQEAPYKFWFWVIFTVIAAILVIWGALEDKKK